MVTRQLPLPKLKNFFGATSKLNKKHLLPCIFYSFKDRSLQGICWWFNPSGKLLSFRLLRRSSAVKLSPLCTLASNTWQHNKMWLTLWPPMDCFQSWKISNLVLLRALWKQSQAEWCKNCKYSTGWKRQDSQRKWANNKLGRHCPASHQLPSYAHWPWRIHSNRQFLTSEFLGHS